eukprot:3861791-Pleurochrysis_carterae.AAC.3
MGNPEVSAVQIRVYKILVHVPQMYCVDTLSRGGTRGEAARAYGDSLACICPSRRVALPDLL